jgi:hypothetical protein
MPLAALLLLPACATPAPPQPIAESLYFSASQCFGACPVYTIALEPDGNATLHRERFTPETGDKSLTLGPERYRRLRDLLAPFRPATGTEKAIRPGEDCDRVATDMPGYHIEWRRSGVATSLDYYAGCFDDRHAALRKAVGEVPEVLGITPLLRPAR